MRDDETPPHVQALNVLEAQVEAFRKDADDAELFAEVVEGLRRADAHRLLAEVCELRAAHEPDPARAAGVWADAGEAHAALGDGARGETALRRALALDPGLSRAVSALAKALDAAGRYAEEAEILEAELASVEGAEGGLADFGATAAAPGLAEQHRALAALWEVRLGRIDRALVHYRRAWRLDPRRPEIAEAARALCASVGDARAVGDLYEEELRALDRAAPPARRARLVSALAKLLADRGETDAAIRRLEEACALVPDDEGPREALAQLCAAAGPEGAPDRDRLRRRAIELDLELAGRRRARGDLDGAASFLRRALGLDPASTDAAGLLEEVLSEAGRHDELEAHLRLRAEVAATEDEAVAAERRRAGLLLDALGRRDEAKRCYEALLPRWPQAAARLLELYRQDGDFQALASLLEREVEDAEVPVDRRVAVLLQLATIARENLGDRDRAAAYLHRSLSLDPQNAEALGRYADHFRDKRDWRGLAELAEFAVETAQAAGAPGHELARRLEEVAETAELRLGDVERALSAWRRVLELEPDSARAREAIRRIESRMRMWESLVSVLEREAAAATGPRERADALCRIAKVYRERQVDPRRAIALYEEALTLFPEDPAALRALADLYEREGDDGGLARTLRRQLDLEAARGAAAPSAGGRGVRDLAGPARVERITTLRRLAGMYETRLADAEGVLYAASGILELLPGDRDALDRLERVLEKTGDVPRLERTLEYHAEAATGPAERTRVLKRLARSAEDRDDPLAALGRWEQVLKAAPNDAEALSELAALYERAGRHADLAAVLERGLSARRHPAPGDAAAARHAFDLRRYARVLDEKLGDRPRAVRAWRQVLELLPRDREALDALARLHEAAADTRALVDVLGRLVPVLAIEDRGRAAETALRRAELLEARLGASAEAARALEDLLAGVDPGNATALARLRRLHELRGDFEAAVRLAERELLLCDPERTPSRRVELGLEVGALCRDRLGDPRRALQAYERVLAVAPDHGGALAACADLYARVGDWPRHVSTLEVLARRAEQPAERRALDIRIAHVVLERLGDPHGAFRRLRAAHELLPDATSLAELRRVAEAHGLFAELAEVYEGERQRVATASPDAYVAACLELAALLERRMGDRRRALAALRDAARARPEDDHLLAEAERVAGDAGPDQEVWAATLALLGDVLERRPPAARVALHERSAALLEERLDDPAAALEELLRAFDLRQAAAGAAGAPIALEAARDAIARLAARTNRWEDVLTVEASLYRRTTGPEARAAVLTRAARLVEEKLRDKVRAFRGWLRAHVATPGDAEVRVHAWRLAREIGAYASAGPPPLPGSAAARARRDSTIPLAIEDLSEVPRDATIELQTYDLLAALGPQTGRPPVPRRGPPPLPLPGLGSPAARTDERFPAAPPARRFGSAWEELAAACEAIPATDVGGRLANLFAAAEVWERGAGDVGRAFETLRRALDLAPGDPEPRARLLRLASERGAWDRLVVVYEEAAERARTADQAAVLLVEAAEAHLRQDRLVEAEAIYRRVLGMCPEDAVARDRLEALYRRMGRWVDLAATLEERANPRLGVAGPEAERPALLRELAEIYEDRLDKPYEAITALERLRRMQPDDVSAIERIARLYDRSGRWSQALEALGRVCELAEGGPAARAARRRIAEIHERELERPDRAIEAYQSLVSAWPDDAEAFAALDRLLEGHARYLDLAEVLRRRALLEREPAVRGEILRRRARVFREWLDRPEDAVACLRQARAIAPDDPALEEEMIEALTAAGRTREAATMLDERIALLERRGAPPGQLAGLLVRLADLKAALGDRDGARRSAERALARVPDYPSALTTLAQLERGSDDPRAYAEARLREAGALVDVGAKVAALLEAATTLRDRAADPDGARAALGRVLELEPANAEATWALASLVATGGDLAAATELLERRLAGELPPEERARVFTELAALAQRAGESAMAEHRLAEALEAQPDHLPAIIARADLLRGAKRFEELEAFLDDALSRIEGVAPAARAELTRRLAEAHEELGRSDEAYARLLDADRLHRNDLLTKLALGDNRYRARRWREAALHLSGLADHPDAPRRAAEVAEGLCHAALAEMRALRPDRSAALYESALRLNPDHAPALHALAEIEMERGNVRRAADLLERQAAACKVPAEKLRLFEALGDLALVALEDGARARACYEAAVAAASPLELRHAPLLEKLLGRQQAAGEHQAAGRTCELLASFAAEPTERAARECQAAEAFLAAGDRTRARAAAERAAEAAPLDENAAWLASDLALGDGDHATVASLLGRAFGAWPPLDASDPATEARRARRAELWRRLGDARRARGDARGARAAHERAVTAEPASDAALAARRALVDALAGDPSAADAVLGHLRALVEAEARPEDVLQTARALARETAAGPVDEDGGRATLELADALGQPLSDTDKAYLARHPARVLAADESYAGALDEDERARLIADPDDEPLARALLVLWEAAPLLWPSPAAALEAVGVRTAEKVSPTTRCAATAIFPQVARALGSPASVLHMTPRAGVDVTVACAAPPLVVLGPRLLMSPETSGAEVDPASDAEVRFLLGRTAELIRPERVPAVGQPAPIFERLCGGLWRAFGAGRGAPATSVPPGVEAEAERLKRVLPMKLRLRLEGLLAGVARERLEAARYRAACQRAADRAGLLVSGNVRIAVAQCGGPAAARHLVRLAIGEAYLTARAKLGIGAR